jgi:hypothetical protein
LPIARSQEVVSIHHVVREPVIRDTTACLPYCHCNPAFQQHIPICSHASKLFWIQHDYFVINHSKQCPIRSSSYSSSLQSTAIFGNHNVSHRSTAPRDWAKEWAKEWAAPPAVADFGGWGEWAGGGGGGGGACGSDFLASQTPSPEAARLVLKLRARARLAARLPGQQPGIST